VITALLAADVGARLLAPCQKPIEPASIDLEEYFSAAEIERGARFARPQAALALARAAVDLGALATVVRRSPRLLGAGGARPVAYGAATGAGLAIALSLPPLPVAAVARKRAIAVGLVTQSWKGWAADLVKATAIEAVMAGGA
jgi:STE24 endopeptidase